MFFSSLAIILIYSFISLPLILITKKKINLLNIIFNSFLINSILLIFLFLKMLLKLESLDFFLLFIISILIGFFLLKKNNLEINFINDFFIIPFFILSLFLLSSLWNLEVPPLHDGIANSYFGKIISQGNFSFIPKSLGFYQPGGGILMAFYSKITSIITPRVNHLLTLISLVWTSILIPYYLTLIFYKSFDKSKNKLKKIKIFSFFYLSYIIVFVLNQWHLTQFYIGSKNSLLIATPYYFIYLFTFLNIFLKNKFSLYDFIILNIFLISSSLIHYTMFFLSLPFWLIIIIKYIFFLKKNKKKLLILFLAFCLIIPTGLFLFIKNKLLIQLLQSQVIFISEKFNFNNIYNLIFKRSFNSFGERLKFLPIFSFILFIIFFIKNTLKRESEFNLFILHIILYLFSFTIFSFTPIHVIKVFVIEYNFYLIPIFLSSLLIAYTIKKDIFHLGIVFLVWFSLLSFYEIKIIKNIKNPTIINTTLISEKDKEAFSWIKSNLKKDYIFFPLQYSYVPDNMRIFDLSPIAYLKIYTDYNSCPEFINSEDHTNCSTKIIPYLKKYKEDLTNKNLIKILKENNIRYFYYSKKAPWGDGVVDINKFKSSYLFKKIYENKFVEIYTYNE